MTISTLQAVRSLPGIVKNPGDGFGATLVFEHRGPAETVWVGIGLAYPAREFFGLPVSGHNPPFTCAMTETSVAQDADWTNYSVSVEGVVPEGITFTSLDAQRFISKSQPSPGQQPPNDYGVNNWDDDIYVYLGGAADGMSELISLMVLMMMMGMVVPMMKGQTGAEG